MKKHSVNLAKNERLEDFGIRNTISGEEQYQELIRQCKELPPDKQAFFWLDNIQHNPILAKQAHLKVVRR